LIELSLFSQYNHDKILHFFIFSSVIIGVPIKPTRQFDRKIRIRRGDVFMLKKLAMGVLATGIMLSGTAGVSAASVSSDISKYRDDKKQCAKWENRDNRFSVRLDSENEIEKYRWGSDRNGNSVEGKLVCYYETGTVGWIAYYRIL
jgi:hypothetical protein